MKTTSKLCAGLAVAFALSAGEASAITLFQNVGGPALVSGGATRTGAFDLSGYLSGGTYKIANAKVTAIGFSNPDVVQTTTSYSEPELVSITPRKIADGYWQSYDCGLFGCKYRWVDPVFVDDFVWQKFHDTRYMDVVLDTLRIDVGEAAGLDSVGQYAFSIGDYFDEPAIHSGTEQHGYTTVHPYRRSITNIWAGEVSAEALLTLNDLAALNSTGQLNFDLDATVGNVFVQQVKLDFDLVSAVPEPATWAMMLVGFFGVGSALRARRRQGLAALDQSADLT